MFNLKQIRIHQISSDYAANEAANKKSVYLRLLNDAKTLQLEGNARLVKSVCVVRRF